MRSARSLRRKGSSPVLETVGLIAVVFFGAAFAFSFMARSASNQAVQAEIQVTQLTIDQGQNLAVVTIQLSNTGLSSITSYTIASSGLEQTADPFSSTISARSGSQSLYANSSTVSSTTFSFSFAPTPATLSGGAVTVIITLTPHVPAEALFTSGNTYVVSVAITTADGDSQTTASVVAGQL